MNSPEGIDALRRAILTDATDTARNEVEQARRSADQARQTAERGAEADRQEILREAKRQAELINRRIASTTEVEAKRQQIGMRERLLREVFDEALEKLKAEQDPTFRREALVRLVAEAAREIGGGLLQLQVASQDMSLVTPEFLKHVEDSMAQQGIRVELTLAEQPVIIVGGAIVNRDKGRVLVDNSFEARMNRQEPNLRSYVWRLLREEGVDNG